MVGTEPQVGARRHDVGRSSRPSVPGATLRTAALSVLSLAAVTAAQVRLARRRYGGTGPGVGLIDTTVVPADPILADGRPLEIVTLGDSGMAGVGVDRLQDTLPVQIASRVAAHVGRPVHVVSYGRSGARTRDVLQQQMALVTRRPDLTVLLVGTNDVTHLAAPRGVTRVTAALLAELVELGSPVVMSSLPEFGAMRAVPPVVRALLQVEAVLVRRAQERAVANLASVQLVDVRRMVGNEFVLDASTMSLDRFHPSAVGYGRIADALAPAVVASVVPPGAPGRLGRPIMAGHPARRAA